MPQQILTVPFSLSVSTSGGKQYYVSPTGNDSNTGTSDSPYKTLQKGVSVLKPGDTLNVRAGTYVGFIVGWDPPNSGPYSVIAGTPQAPITIQADPLAAPGSVIVNSRNNKTAAAIDLEPGCDYLTINGFRVTSDNTVTRYGIVSHGNSTVITNNTVVGVGVGSTGAVAGIHVNGTSNALVQGNVVTGTTGSNSTGHGIYIANSMGCVCRGNVVHDNGAGFQFNGDPNIIGNALIENNIVYNNNDNGFNCDGIQNSTFRNNLIYTWPGHYGIVLFKIDASGPSINNLIVNNTIVSAVGGAALRINGSGTGNTVFNNILLGGDGNAYRIASNSLSGLVSDFNVVSGNFQSDDTGSEQTLAQWRSSTGQDTHSFVSTPALLFVNIGASDYHLLSSSPAIDKAVANLNGKFAPTIDLDGIPRPFGAGLDIGCYEWHG